MKSHCKHNHPLNPDTVYQYVDKTGRIRQSCKECVRTLARTRYANGKVLNPYKKDRPAPTCMCNDPRISYIGTIRHCSNCGVGYMVYHKQGYFLNKQEWRDLCFAKITRAEIAEKKNKRIPLMRRR